MTVQRLILVVWLGCLLGGPAAAQTAPKAYPPPPVPDQPGPAMLPAAAPKPAAPTATGTLLGEGPPSGAYPPGTVTSPWSGGHEAGGPVGGNGPLAYELIASTGINLPVAGGAFSGKLNTGWANTGTLRTLYFNRDADAAWVLNLGLTYTYNRGQQNRQLEVFTSPPTRVDSRDGIAKQLDPDALTVNVIRGLHRTSFDFGVGRDWWIGGPAATGQGTGINTRFGIDMGGKYGTAHVDLVPILDRTFYQRRTGVFHSATVGTHIDWEIPVGAYIVTSGFRAEYDYTWTNLLPPSNGDIVNVNLMFNLGVRY